MGRHAPYLREMGLVRWRHTSRKSPEPPDHSDVELTTGGGENQDATSQLLALAVNVAGCDRCELHRTRNQTVFGAGNTPARWLFVGEAPGAEEDKQGFPFVGRAGVLLNAMLFSIGLSREEVYIANVLKCRPPNNRDPFGREVR
ncbi:MAG TPA: uracil-DNA glycosylase, partial [Gammaproteobacteria bacterium]|nr:uracil-DNA glycosylase [Gammaproteobacteria bacterium]